MNKLQFIHSMYSDTYNNVTHMTNLLMTMFHSHLDAERVDLSKCFVLNMWADAFVDSPIDESYYDFSEAADKVIYNMRRMNLNTEWKNWLKSQLDEESNEAKLVKGCRQLSRIMIESMQKGEIDKTVASKFIAQIDDYCDTSDSLTQFFKEVSHAIND